MTQVLIERVANYAQSYKKVKPKGNEYIYLNHFKDCDNPQLSEVKALKPIEEELKRLYVRKEIFSYIKKDLERVINKQNEAHNREVKMVRRQYDNCQDKQISYNLRKTFDLIDSLNEKTPPKIEGVAIGDA